MTPPSPLFQHPEGLATQTQKIKGVEYEQRKIDIHVKRIMPLFTAKQRLILTGKRYLVDIYERSKHSKSHEDWIKNSCVVVS